MAKARAVVQVGDRQFEIQQFDLPSVGSDDALIRVEACGICGSDVDQYDGKLNGMGLRLPVIPGHEPVGIIEEIGAEASRRWGVKAGDRVAVEPVLGCGHCRACMQGFYRRCRTGRPGTAIAACGFIPTHIKPALWGGLAEYMYVDPNAAVHKVSRDIPAELAALYQPVAAGISWAHREPGTRVGDTVVVFGAGQRGLACVVAAREAGASKIFVVARRQSAHRLKLAIELGASAALFADEDTVAQVRDLTLGEGADVVIDVTAETMGPIAKAIDMARAGGTVVLAGVKGWGVAIPGMENDRIFSKELTIKGVKNADFRSFEIAVRLIESRKYPFEKMHTHSFGLEKLDLAIRTLAGRVPGEIAISVSIDPSL
ncbi:MAG TPA: zinc-binding dehydrogenase [Candidatus Binataceae bacterium]|nr:zinc-binding dehydrogenase [Candidatus Binataceae bacterium]